MFTYVTDKEQRVNLLNETRHNLGELLRELKKHIGGVMESEGGSLSWLKTFFDSIDEFDRDSDSFRYPFSIRTVKNNQGEKEFVIKTMHEDKKHIDLQKFGSKMLCAYEVVKSIYHKEVDELSKTPELKPILFETGGHFFSQSVVNYKINHKKFFPYVKGYLESSKILYELMMSKSEEEIQSVNELFLPMCYLFRNALELLIKQVIFEESSYEPQEALKKFNSKKHRILSLWNLISTEIVERAGADETDTTTDIACDYIRQINDFDFSADKFRYPINNKISVYFAEPEKFDIVNTYEFFMEITSVLEAIHLMMASQNEEIAEMEYEMQPYYSDF